MDISIKNPCHENWNDMTPNEQGAFCGKCVKTVIDFSTRSVEEIKEFFALKQEERICGRFEKTQLVSLNFDDFFNEFKRFNLTKRLAVIVYFTFGVALFSPSSLNAQTEIHETGDITVITYPKGDVSVTVPADTAKPCKKPDESNMIMGKIIAPKPTQSEEKMKMGEVKPIRKQPGPKYTTQKKPMPKK